MLKEGFKTMPYHINTILSNDTSNKTLQWELGTGHSPMIEKGIFVIQPVRGTLEKGQKASVRISFYPKDKKIYHATVPVYLDNKKDKVYLELELTVRSCYGLLLLPFLLLTVVCFC